MLLKAMSMVSGNYISDIKNEKSMDNYLSHPCPCILVYLIYSILIVYCHGERITLNF